MKKIILALLLSLGLSGFLFAEGIIITHASVPTKSISTDDVSKLYLGKQTKWANGDSVVITYISNVDITGESFYKDYVGRSIKKFKKYWVKQVFAGNGSAPKTFTTASQAYRYVKSHKGSFAYVPVGTSTKGVNVLSVDGKQSY